MDINQGLFAFIKKSPTAFHAAAAIREILTGSGFAELRESEAWEVIPGGKYYVLRNDSSIIAFKVGTGAKDGGFMIAASHSDSPMFKIKENACLEVRKEYIQLNTEGYGGMLCAPWLDRPLSVAGRLVVRSGDRYTTKLVDVGRSLALIPSVAIHMDRSANENASYNKQVDMLPLFAQLPAAEDSLISLVAAQAGVAADSIYGSELFLYNCMEPTMWGAGNEFISAPRLDDLQCAYTSLLGFLQGSNDRAVQVYACFDNEEVGSCTKQGADSSFLSDTLSRCSRALGRNIDDHHRALASSFMLSCDNAHALHPNHPEKSDAKNYPVLNGGVVMKAHAGQKYTSDAVSMAVWKGICEKAGVPLQHFANRSDAVSGGTLGNIASSHVSVNSVDIGLAQLAMHSPYETAGARDSEYMHKAVKAFYSSAVCCREGALQIIE